MEFILLTPPRVSYLDNDRGIGSTGDRGWVVVLETKGWWWCQRDERWWSSGGGGQGWGKAGMVLKVVGGGQGQQWEGQLKRREGELI